MDSCSICPVDWLILFSIMCSMFIQVTYGRIYLLLIILHCMYILHFITHSSISGHLGCFHLLAISNNGTMNIDVQIYFWISAFNYFIYIPRSGIVGWYGNANYNFLIKHHSVFDSSCTILHSYQQHDRVPIFLHPYQHFLFFFIAVILRIIK